MTLNLPTERIPPEETAGQRFAASYLIETAFPLKEAATSMAGEQSTGTFLKLEGEDDPLVQRQAARVEALEEAGDAEGLTT